MKDESFAEFESWRDIKEWAEQNGYINMAKRMQLNNDCWNSSGEFGRNQVFVCDSMRMARNEKARHEFAKMFDDSCKENFGLY